MFYKNTKAMVRSPDGDMISSTLSLESQGDTLAPYMFIYYVLWMPIYLIKENGFTFIKQEAEDISQKLTDADYVDVLQQPKLNPFYIAWSKLQKALVST